MKQIIEFIPLIIFFALYKMYDIYTATGALIVASILQVLVLWFIYKKVEKMQWVTAILVTVFGGMTLFFQDDNFIKWKVTIVYVLFAAGLLITHLMGKPLIKGMLGKEIALSDTIWRNVNHAWVAFFAVLAVVNVIIAYQMPLDVWVNFKVFGLMALTLIYTLITGAYVYKHLPKEKEIDSE